MNNKPYIWMDDLGTTISNEAYKELDDYLKDGLFPLYTHPAKCNKCNDTEWVCENHSDQEAHKCNHCEGAGKPCECTHPAKELHLSLQKVKDTGELLAVTYTDDEHRIVEVLWQKPPAKTLTDDVVNELWAKSQEDGIAMQQGFTTQQHYFAHLILRKAQEK